MTELSFVRQFLAQLDAKPIKYQPDYAADPRTLEITKAYTLPRMDMPMHKVSDTSATSASAPGTDSSPKISITLRSARNPPLELTLSSLSPTSTTVLDLKKAVASSVGLAAPDKVRVLHRKKPCSDVKTVAEVLGDEHDYGAAQAVEFGVMIIGGVPEKKAEEEAADVAMAVDDDPPATAPSPTTAPVAVGPAGREVLDGREFWADLEGFLNQRVKDTEVAAAATRLFEKAWREGTGA